MCRADNPHPFLRPEHDLQSTGKKKQWTMDCRFNVHILIFIRLSLKNVLFLKVKWVKTLFLVKCKLCSGLEKGWGLLVLVHVNFCAF